MYYLGIDGGGTKTEFLLEDENGKETSLIIPSSSNPTDVGIERVKSVLKKGIESICDGIPYDEISLFAGIAGGITGNNRFLIADFLKTFGFTFFDNGSDAQNTVSLALGDNDGITVIMGTGSVAFSQKNGKLTRCGGYGYLFEEGGSGFSVARDAIIASLKAEESHADSVLLSLLKDALQSDSLLEKAGELHQKGKRYIASLCPIVFEAFSKGDCLSEEILFRNMKSVAELIELCTEKTGFTSFPVKTVFAGGLSKSCDILIPMIKTSLQSSEKYSFETIKKAPVYGALNLAKRGAQNA